MAIKQKTETLKDIFIKEIEKLIISGELHIGQKLLPERDLAEKMKVSRIVVHSGLKELAVKGFVTIIPRQGTFVNDYIKGSTLNILNSLTNYSGKLSSSLAKNMVDLRCLLELESVRLAAQKRTDDDLKTLGRIILREDVVDKENIEEITNIDFEFHHFIALCSKNIMYSSILKTLEALYIRYAYEFFEKTQAYQDVFHYHHQLYEAIKDRSAENAAVIMSKILKHGEKLCKDFDIY